MRHAEKPTHCRPRIRWIRLPLPIGCLTSLILGNGTEGQVLKCERNGVYGDTSELGRSFACRKRHDPCNANLEKRRLSEVVGNTDERLSTTKPHTGIIRNSLTRGGAVRQLARLITSRSQVRILSPPLSSPVTPKRSDFDHRGRCESDPRRIG